MTSPNHRLRIGVLALQGGFTEHIHALHRIPYLVSHVLEIKLPHQLKPRSVTITSSTTLDTNHHDDDDGIDALIIPGGESTTIALAAERVGLMVPLRKWVQDGRPVWGTCAGMIMLSDSASHTKQSGQSLITGLHVTVHRNAFGHQSNSFIEDIVVDNLGTIPAVFIRAPVIDTVNSDDTKVIARARGPGTDPNQEPSLIVAVKQNHILATAFHPELTNNTRMHEYFVDMVHDYISKQQH